MTRRTKADKGRTKGGQSAMPSLQRPGQREGFPPLGGTLLSGLSGRPIVPLDQTPRGADVAGPALSGGRGATAANMPKTNNFRPGCPADGSSPMGRRSRGALTPAFHSMMPI